MLKNGNSNSVLIFSRLSYRFRSARGPKDSLEDPRVRDEEVATIRALQGWRETMEDFAA